MLKTFRLPLAPKHIIDQYTEKISSTLKKQYLLDCENQKLAELRDWLLPMLMNGQVTVR